MPEEKKTKVVEGVIEDTSVSKPKISGNKRSREEQLTEVPFSEEEEVLLEEEEDLLEEEESVETMADDRIDAKILDYLIEIRRAENGLFHGVRIRFDSREIWQEMARSLNVDCAEFLNHEIMDHVVFNRAKAMRLTFRARTSRLCDKYHWAFGSCEHCGNIAEFPPLYRPARRSLSRSPLRLSNSEASSSGQQISAQTRDAEPNPTQASINRITSLVNADQVTVEDGRFAIEWLQRNSDTGASYFYGLTDAKLIIAVRGHNYLNQENAE